MATRSGNFRNDRNLFEAPAEAGRAAAIGSALEAVEFLRMLPDAFIGTQQRELERLRNSGDPDNPHIPVLEASLERATAVRSMAQKGHARLQRAIAIAADPENAFHGFVTDRELEPLAGLTVRLKGDDVDEERLCAVTGADGYFRIPLGTKRDRKQSTGFAERIAALSARMNRGRNAAASDSGSAGGQKTTARVEIVSDGKVVHRDPTGVILEGRLYREYIISEAGKPRAESAAAPGKKSARRKG